MVNFLFVIQILLCMTLTNSHRKSRDAYPIPCPSGFECGSSRMIGVAR
jgi:hypothetical protein